ncbi:MAG: hypothetical protein KKC26_01605, partial [Nanoarchaeota archaeon]|nr:hypothetical protein [Nanoarchaeota archaeon]
MTKKTITKILVLMIVMITMMFSVQAATLTCQQVSSANLEISQFASKTVEIRCTASGGTVSNIQITPNSNPSTGLTIANSQSMSSSISDQSSSTGKWTVTGDSPNTYTISYTISSSGTNSWTGASTTTADVQSTAQLTVEYVLPPSIFTPTVDSLDYRITNIGGTTATNVKMALYNGATLVYGPTDYPVVEGIAAGATTALQWTNQTGFNESGTYTTKVYIGEILHDSAIVSVLTVADGYNQTIGWNLISLPREADDMSASAVLADISNVFEIIYRYDGGSIWKSYDGLGGAPDTLSTLSVEKGYWLKTTDDTTLNVSGTVPSSTTISLAVGWNLKGYPSADSKDVAATYSSIVDDLDSVWQYNGGVDWDSYDGPSGSPDTLTSLTPGKGYWVKMDAT